MVVVVGGVDCTNTHTLLRFEKNPSLLSRHAFLRA